MALDDRKVTYETEGISRSYEDQAAMLTAEKKANPNLKAIFSQVLQDVHQVSRKLVDSADIIAFEDLNISGMLQNHNLAKHIQDVSWGKLIQFTLSKASRAGKSVVFVDPRNTSQRCSGCGAIVQKDLSEMVHDCPSCGLSIDRDLNAAKNILTLGLRGRAYGDPTPTLKLQSKPDL